MKENPQSNPISSKKSLHAAMNRRAVELKLEGKTIKAIKQITGLSAPTIISLFKTFTSGGWAAVENRRPGRPNNSNQFNDQNPYNLSLQTLLNDEIQSPDLSIRKLWTISQLAKYLTSSINKAINARMATRILQSLGWVPQNSNHLQIEFSVEDSANHPIHFKKLIGGDHDLSGPLFINYCLLYARDLRGVLYLMPFARPLKDEHYLQFIQKLLEIFPVGIAINLRFSGLQHTPKLRLWLNQNTNCVVIQKNSENQWGNIAKPKKDISNAVSSNLNSLNHLVKFNPQSLANMNNRNNSPTHLQRLEAESIHIMREVVSEADNPVMLYSIGKDSAVMLHLALKAFYPAKLPFPLLHVDTTWKFQDMYAFREKMRLKHDFELLIHTNPDGLAQGINPFVHGSQIHTDIMKTQGLKQALDHFGFDVAFGGARRDEEKSRAKERIFSFRNSQHRWDPKQQRPELWNLYNTKKNKGESIRAFPLSNWTELDIWQYIYLENIDIVPLYFAKERPVVMRDGSLIMVDDSRMQLDPGEVPQIKKVRFRTLGCYPLTGAVESQAITLPEIIREMLLTKTSERQGRVIDHDGAASMEKKKQEGYF